MNKEESIKRYGEAAYAEVLQQGRDWHAWRREIRPEEVKAKNQEYSCKGGKYYKTKLKYRTTGLQGKREKIREKHRRRYRSFKRIIAPDSQIHHEWIPGTAEYTGIALVETDQHMHGFVDVIKILDGKITLLTEKEIAKQGGI